MINFSLDLQFPNTRHIGCYFHFTQTIHRQIQILGLATIYRDEEHARSSVRKLMALPLVPLNEMECAFEEMFDKAPDSIKPLVDYFNGYWMRKVKLNLWNVSDLNVRTNNLVEGEFFPLFFISLTKILK
jgi:hypothetical protein